MARFGTALARFNPKLPSAPRLPFAPTATAVGDPRVAQDLGEGGIDKRHAVIWSLQLSLTYFCSSLNHVKSDETQL